MTGVWVDFDIWVGTGEVAVVVVVVVDLGPPNDTLLGSGEDMEEG